MFGELNIFFHAGVLLKYCQIPEVSAAAKQKLSKEEAKKTVYKCSTRIRALKTNENWINVFKPRTL